MIRSHRSALRPPCTMRCLGGMALPIGGEAALNAHPVHFNALRPEAAAREGLLMSVLDPRGGENQRRPCDSLLSVLDRTTAPRRTAALGRQQLAGTGRPSAAVRSPRSPVPKLPLSSAKRSAALPLCRRRLSQTGGRRCSDRRATSDQPDPAGVERVRLACSAVTTLTGTPSRSMR